MAENERETFLEWSGALGIERQVAVELLRHMPDDSALDPELPYWIASPSYVMAPQGLAFEEPLRREGYVVVGSCPNGDPVAVSVRDSKLPVYYINHEEWECESLEQIMRKVSDSIAAYDKALSERDPQLPLDYWDRRAG